MKKSVQIFIVALFFSLLFFGLPFYSHQSIALTRMASGLQDTLFKFRHSADSLPEQADHVVIVSIDDESCEKLNARWPWSRKIFADLVDALKRQGAQVIALNFSFNGLENDAQTTALLAEAIRGHGRVVVGATLDDQRLLKPNDLLIQAGAVYGYLEKIVDDDYVIRRSYLGREFTGLGKRWEFSFPLRVVSFMAEGTSLPTMDELIQRASDGEGQYPIDFLMNENDFKRIPAWKILQNRSSDQALKGKIVFVGITSSLLAEKHTTPLGLMPGVLVHANEVVALTAGRYLRSWSEPIVNGVAYVVSSVILALILSRRWWIGLIAALAVLFLTFLAAQMALSQDWLIQPFILLAGPALAMLFGVMAELLILFLEKRGLEKKVVHDKMTGLYTYEYLRSRLDEEWKRCLKMQLPVSVVMTDLDYFKKINDTLGHEVGNQMILRASDVNRKSVRGYDVVSRYGGDEFAILLWHSNEAEALAYRLRLRKQYEQMASELTDPLLKQSSMSIGVASFDPKENQAGPKTPQELMEAADKDLFSDKAGRRKSPR